MAEQSLLPSYGTVLMDWDTPDKREAFNKFKRLMCHIITVAKLDDQRAMSSIMVYGGDEIRDIYDKEIDTLPAEEKPKTPAELFDALEGKLPLDKSHLTRKLELCNTPHLKQLQGETVDVLARRITAQMQMSNLSQNTKEELGPYWLLAALQYHEARERT